MKNDCERCKHDAGHELNGVGMWICLGCRADITTENVEATLASESQRKAAGTADEKPDGQAEN